MQPQLSSFDPPRFTSAPTVYRFVQTSSLRTLQLLRSVHLYCSLGRYQPANPYFHLFQSIETRLSRLIPFATPVTPPLLNPTSKITALIRIAQWGVKDEVTSTELLSLYRQWRLSNDILTPLDVFSDPEIDQIETYFVLKDLHLCSESDLELLVKQLESIHSSYLQSASLGVDHDKNPISSLNSTWFDLVLAIFRYLDEDDKGHLDAENALWLMLALMLPESAEDADEETLRKQVAKQLEQVKASRGCTNLHQFEVYLLYQGLQEEESLRVLMARLEYISGQWQAVKSTVLPVESSRHFPALWQEAVCMTVKDDFLRKYLLSNGLEIAYLRSSSTKGKTYAVGSFFPYPLAFSQALYTAYISTLGESFPHLPADPRYQSILTTVNKYCSLSKASVAKVIGRCRDS